MIRHSCLTTMTSSGIINLSSDELCLSQQLVLSSDAILRHRTGNATLSSAAITCFQCHSGAENPALFECKPAWLPVTTGDERTWLRVSVTGPENPVSKRIAFIPVSAALRTPLHNDVCDDVAHYLSQRNKFGSSLIVLCRLACQDLTCRILGNFSTWKFRWWRQPNAVSMTSPVCDFSLHSEEKNTASASMAQVASKPETTCWRGSQRTSE